MNKIIEEAKKNNYQIGDIFTDPKTNRFYILCCPSYPVYAAIDLSTGGRHTDATSDKMEAIGNLQFYGRDVKFIIEK